MFSIYIDKVTLIFILVILIALLSHISYFIAYRFYKSSLLFVFIILASLAVILPWAKNLFLQKPALIISPTGLYINTHGFISWNNIASIDFSKMNPGKTFSSRVLKVTLKDNILKKDNFFQTLFNIFPIREKNEFWINQFLLDKSARDLIILLNKYIPVTYDQNNKSSSTQKTLGYIRELI